MPNNDFGIIIGTCRFDFFLAKSCVASVRQYLPDTPLTLLLDDYVDTSEIAKAYNVNTFYRTDIKDKFLREYNSGYGRPKISLLWESPYERFLFIDCDTVMWGDVVSRYLQGDWDMAIDAGDPAARPWTPGVGTEAFIRRDYFGIEQLEANYPSFPWRKYQDWCFCTGVWASRRGLFSIDEYKALIEKHEQNRGMFLSGEMGYLNFMIFRAVEEGRIKVSRQLFQYICDRTNTELAAERFKMGPQGPIVSPGDEKVLHFTSPKPLMWKHGFKSPVVHFRRLAAKKLTNIPSPFINQYLRAEESRYFFKNEYRARFGGFHQKFVAPMQRLIKG